MNKRKRIIKLIGTVILIIILVIIFTNSANLINKNVDTFIVNEGTLSYEEQVEGYIIREEVVLKGNNYSNGLDQIIVDGERVSKGEAVFRYYSNNEEEIVKQIEDLDKQIDEALENNKSNLPSVDIDNLEIQIEKLLDELQYKNELQTIEEYEKKIDSYIIKKAEIAGENSPAGSFIKELIAQRNALNSELTSNSEIIYAQNAGVVSYRVDGLEEVLKSNDFSYLTTDLLNGFELNVGSSIPESKEHGKVVNNFKAYIACSINTENADVAEIGNEVTLRLSDSSEISAKIVYIKEEENGRILVFEIDRNIESLLEYRKISLEIIWWQYSGLKVSNKALIEEDGLTYVKRQKAGNEEKILVKVLRQNDTYSIVDNYSDEELESMGYTLDEIQEMSTIKRYDQILVKNVT